MIKKRPGFIPISKGFGIEALWNKTPYHFLVYYYLLVEANYKDSNANDGRLIKRGQALTSVTRLSKLINASRVTVRKVLRELEEDGEISLGPPTYGKYQIINLLNYEEIVINAPTVVTSLPPSESKRPKSTQRVVTSLPPSESKRPKSTQGVVTTLPGGGNHVTRGVVTWLPHHKSLKKIKKEEGSAPAWRTGNFGPKPAGRAARPKFRLGEED